VVISFGNNNLGGKYGRWDHDDDRDLGVITLYGAKIMFQPIDMPLVQMGIKSDAIQR
jgi:hypothetical protein